MSRSTRVRIQEAVCPRCQQVAERYIIRITNGKEETAPDTPRRKCPHCGHLYFDGHFYERALQEYNAKPFSPSLVLWSIVLIASIGSLVMDGKGLAAPTAMNILDAVLAFASVAMLLWALYIRRNQTALNARCRKKSEQRLDAHCSDDELGRSLRRLSQEEYLYFLLANDVEVPEYFFRRIGCVFDAVRAEKESERCVDEKRQHAEFADREAAQKAADAEREHYEYFLSLDPNGSLFKRHAQCHNMSPERFREHCQSMVSKQ